MSDGSQSRRTVMGLVWIVMITAFSAPGCAQIPVPRANSNQVHLPRPTTAPVVATNATEVTPAPADDGEALPPLPETLAPASDVNDSPAPTPLLDEALAKANAELVVEPSRLPPDVDRDDETGEAPAEAKPTASTDDAGKVPNAGTASASTKDTADDSRAIALIALSGGATTAPPAPLAIDPSKPVKPVDPLELWSEGLDRLRRIANDQSKLPGAGDWTRRARVLDVLAETNGRDDATADADGPCRLALAALGIPHDPGALGGPPRGAELRAAVLALEEEAPLEISELQVCRKVGGFGNFEPLDAAACKPGQPVIIYCEMSGVQYAPAGDSFHSRLASRVELVPSNGGKPVWAQALGSAEDVCRRRRRDYYVNYRIVLADTISPGVYELRVVQNDEIAGRSTSASIPLTIQP